MARVKRAERVEVQTVDGELLKSTRTSFRGKAKVAADRKNSFEAILRKMTAYPFNDLLRHLLHNGVVATQ